LSKKLSEISSYIKSGWIDEIVLEGKYFKSDFSL
jgi:hypothetical protein